MIKTSVIPTFALLFWTFPVFHICYGSRINSRVDRSVPGKGWRQLASIGIYSHCVVADEGNDKVYMMDGHNAERTYIT